VSGIGNSRSFRRSAESIGIKIIGESAFEDHHRYTHREIEQIRRTVQVTGSEFVLTTEKDGGKLIPFLTPSDPWWMLRLGTEVVQGEEQLRKLIDVPSSEGDQQLKAHA
jgi:tetraacyldisaccharide 4'-kinase